MSSTYTIRSPLLYRATSGLYPPGSTFKIVTAADALDAGIITLDTTFDDTGGLPVGSFTVRNDEEERTGRQNLTGAFALWGLWELYRYIWIREAWTWPFPV